MVDLRYVIRFSLQRVLSVSKTPTLTSLSFPLLCRYAAFYKEVVQRSARLVAQWQCVGFVHGVCGTGGGGGGDRKGVLGCVCVCARAFSDVFMVQGGEVLCFNFIKRILGVTYVGKNAVRVGRACYLCQFWAELEMYMWGRELRYGLKCSVTWQLFLIFSSSGIHLSQHPVRNIRVLANVAYHLVVRTCVNGSEQQIIVQASDCASDCASCLPSVVCLPPGVMNTDNLSLAGLTIDYGPFGFMDAYNPHYVPNYSGVLFFGVCVYIYSSRTY